MFNHCVRPIVCPPRYVVRERFVPREIPIIHPIVKVIRTNKFRKIRVNEVNDLGFTRHRRF